MNPQTSSIAKKQSRGMKRMPAIGAVLALALFQGVQTGRSAISIYTVQVSSTVPWTDTGIDVPSGSRLVINASGTVVYGTSSQQVTDANGGDYTGQQFFPTAVYPNTTIVSLIGKIGGTTAVGTGIPVPEGLRGTEQVLSALLTMK